MTTIAVVLTSIVLLVAAAYFFYPAPLFVMATRIQRRAAGLRTRDIAVGDDRVAYVEGGKGEPLLLLHGFGGNKDHWLLIAKHLTPYFRVIAPDLPGFGESTRRSTARYAVVDQIERIRGFAEALGLSSFHLGGNSMGGHIAAAYAARYPETVDRLWLLAPAGVESADQSELLQCLARGENPMLVDDADDFDRLMAMCFERQPYVPPPFKRYFIKRAIAERAFNQKVFQELVTGPLWLESELRDLPVPTLIVWADRDRLLDVSGAEILRSVIPKAEVVIMKDCGHVPMVERPRETAEHFLRFSHGALRYAG
jgi:pimeloyl-ACP methyl ester carboxylesterase